MSARSRLAICLLALLLFSPIVAREYRRALPPSSGPAKDPSLALLADLLGELRTTVAAVFFVKSEMYFHELEAGQNVKEQTETMPLFRLVTILDPHMIQAYDTGSNHLAMDLRKVEEGLAFLEEGLANNPDSPELHFRAAFIHFFRTRDDNQVVEHVRRAEQLATEKFLKANSVRLRAYAFFRLRNYPESLAGFRDLLTILPGDPAAVMKIKQLKDLVEKPD